MIRKKLLLSSKVLKWARVTRFGARKEVAAKKLGIITEDLDNWETVNPTLSVAKTKKIAKVYKRHISVIMLKTPPVSQEPPRFRTLPDFERVDFDEKTFFAIRQAQEIQITASFLLENKENLNLKELANCSNDWNKLATKVAELLRLDNDSRFRTKTSKEQLVLWKRSIESLGIIVLQQSFPIKDSRAFTIYDKIAPIIVLNSSDTDNARIFSLFHELGHLVLGQTDVDRELSLNIKSTHKDEFFCNNFAASFLVPINLFKEFAGRIHNFNDENVKQLANRFKVSTSVIWIRLYNYNYISQVKFNEIKDKLSIFEAFSTSQKRTKSGGNKNTYLYTKINNKGEFYISEVFEAYNMKRISYYDVLDYIGIKSDTLPKLQRLMFA